MLQIQCCALFFFNDTATTEIYTLSLHDALPIFALLALLESTPVNTSYERIPWWRPRFVFDFTINAAARSEEHTSELQSRLHLVCRLLLEKKKAKQIHTVTRK